MSEAPPIPSSEVVVFQDVIDAIVEHGRRDAPRECCGLLVGDADGIDECVPTTNLAVERSRFLVNPDEHIALNRRLRGSRRTVVGVYHSHPDTPPVPSPRDIAEAHYPQYLHIIASLVGDPGTRVRAFRIHDGCVVEVSLRINAAG